jgi:ACDE family multidrug resistance protein
MENRAAFMSMNGMMLRLGQTLGPVITGLFFISAGLDATFFAGAGIALLVLILLYSNKS